MIVCVQDMRNQPMQIGSVLMVNQRTNEINGDMDMEINKFMNGTAYFICILLVVVLLAFIVDEIVGFAKRNKKKER